MKMNKLDLSYCLSFFITIAIVLTIIIYNSNSINKDEYQQITIAPGDTLWEISKQYDDLIDMSTIEFVNWVSKVNKIEKNSIIPGQEIFIPVKIEDAPLLAKE